MSKLFDEHHVTSISISLHHSPNSNKQISIRNNWTQFETVDNLMEFIQLFRIIRHQISSAHTRVHARVLPNQIIAIACIPYARSKKIYTNIAAYTHYHTLVLNHRWKFNGLDSFAKNTISIHCSLAVSISIKRIEYKFATTVLRDEIKVLIQIIWDITQNERKSSSANMLHCNWNCSENHLHQLQVISLDLMARKAKAKHQKCRCFLVELVVTSFIFTFEFTIFTIDRCEIVNSCQRVLRTEKKLGVERAKTANNDTFLAI